MGFKTDYRLMQVKSIAECSKGSLPYFRSSLSYHLLLRLVLSIFEWPLKTGFTVEQNGVIGTFTNCPQQARKMHSKPSFIKKGCYTCQWLDKVGMHMQLFMKIYHAVKELGVFH